MNDKKKGLWDTIKDAVVEQTPDVPARNTPLPMPRVTPLPTAPTVGEHPYGSPVTPDPKALETLESKLDAALPEAYKGFIEQYNNLDGVIPDEATRMKAALKTSHTSIEQIVGAFDQLLGVMDVAHADFQKKFDSNKTSVLGAAKQQIDATDELIHTREAQLKSIQDEIVSLKSKRSADAEQMQNEEARLDGIRKGFEAALVQIVGRLNGQKARISTQR